MSQNVVLMQNVEVDTADFLQAYKKICQEEELVEDLVKRRHLFKLILTFLESKRVQ